MKKRHPLLLVILLTVLLSIACNLGSHTRTVRVNDGQTSLKIEYNGKIFFTPGETAIDAISPGGYVEYRKNNKKLIAEPNGHGTVVYKLYFGDQRLNLNDSAAKTFFASAMKEIAGHYNR